MSTDRTPDRVCLVAARNEADRLGTTLDALAAALPGVVLIVADDASTDGTADVARSHGARVVRGERSRGKGANVTAAAELLLARTLEPDPPTVLLCDADLGESAGELAGLCEAVEAGEADLAIARFARRVGGGVGLAVGFSRWAIRDLCGYEAGAPISGQRAMRGEVLAAVVPFAHGYGMETAMTSDAVRAGFRVTEVELDLSHRATGRSIRGFAHRGRQLAHIARAWSARRWGIG